MAIPHVALFFVPKVSLQEVIEGNHTHSAPRNYCTSALTIRISVFVYQEENITDAHLIGQVDLLKSEQLSLDHMNSKFGPFSLGRKDCPCHLLLTSNICDPKKGIPGSAEKSRHH